MRQLLTEGLVLALMGGGLGLVLAFATNTALSRLQLPVPVDVALGLSIDVRVVSFTFAVCVLATLVCGLAPALEGSRVDLVSALRQRGPATGASTRRLHDVLVVAQVGVSVLLLVCTGLAVRSVLNAQRIDLGFEPGGVVVATVAPQLQGYTRPARSQLYDRVRAEVQALPGVQSAGWTSHLPLTFEMTFARIAAAGDESRPSDSWRTVDAATVGPGYLQTLRVPQVRGRSFAETDTADTPPVAVVNESLAARLWPDQETVGQRLLLEGSDASVEVVGVVRDGKYRTLGETPRPFLYLPVTQTTGGLGGAAGAIATGTRTLVVRVAGEPQNALAALSSIREVVRQIDPVLAITRLTTLDDALGASLSLPRVAGLVLGVFSLVGLLLAATGIYGMLAYTVSQRRRELGIRVALGAQRPDVVALVSRRALSVTGVGLLLGLAAASVTTRALGAILYGVSPTDPWVFAAVSLFLVLVALLAVVAPARQASRVDPVVLLRAE